MILDLEELLVKYNINIDGVAHFGAHLGQEVKTYQKLKFKNIYLFEPQKEIYDQLSSKNISYANVHTYNFGLGSSENKVKLHLDTNDGQSSSVLKPLLHLDMHPDVKFNSFEDIEIKRYDSLNINDVNFLNIDIQGFELEALRGSEEVLNNITCIYTEINRDYVYENCSLVGEIDEYLKNFGFLRVETKWWKGFYIWGDAFYINTNILKTSRFKIMKAKIFNFIYTKKFYFLFNEFLEMKIRKSIFRFKKKLKKI